MTVPAFPKPRQNSALRNRMLQEEHREEPGRAVFSEECRHTATNLTQIGPIPTPGASRIADTIEPLSPSS
jgi:hypothetical protein